MEAEGREHERGRPWRPIVWLLVGIAVVSAGGVAVSLLVADRTPRATLELVEENEDRWRRNGIEDYDLTLTKTQDRRENEKFVAKIRSGEVTELELDGRPVRPTSFYSVEGLFETIREELEMARSADPKEGQRQSALVKAAFHDSLGAPLAIKVLAPKTSFTIEVQEIRVPGKGRIYSRTGGDTEEGRR